ncbi:unnamed protein product [Scytosiphon promiscuus]
MPDSSPPVCENCKPGKTTDEREAALDKLDCQTAHDTCTSKADPGMKPSGILNSSQGPSTTRRCCRRERVLRKDRVWQGVEGTRQSTC